MTTEEVVPDCGAVAPDEECGACESCIQADEEARRREGEFGIVHDTPGTTS
ncbi:hypothetical protein [Streptomyces sp. NPDC096142]|uniref:hypothetical protein n=1 Tax=Streptomyces sp. NPDC096142 TaxID=3366077 RepID=UPI0037F84EC3